eukprot:scaffold6506_cov171-Amphora_coffeaeformis.AAC.23
MVTNFTNCGPKRFKWHGIGGAAIDAVFWILIKVEGRCRASMVLEVEAGTERMDMTLTKSECQNFCVQRHSKSCLISSLPARKTSMPAIVGSTLFVSG